LIGNAIYDTIEKLIGSEFAPKVTGMIIDLNDLEMIPAISTLENLKIKVRDAHTLLEQIKLHQEMSARAASAAPVSGVPAANPAK
jgi:Poly-adenylate binding protein, unique domain